jgi:hypothetical protein
VVFSAAADRVAADDAVAVQYGTSNCHPSKVDAAVVDDSVDETVDHVVVQGKVNQTADAVVVEDGVGGNCDP